MKKSSKEFFEYQYEQAVILRLASQRTGGLPLKRGQRAYFDNDPLKENITVVAITLPTIGPLPIPANQFFYQDVIILPGVILSDFTFTAIDNNGDVVLWNYPLANLCNINMTTGLQPGQSFGKNRLFNFKIDIKKSYVTLNGFTILATNHALLFNFYLRD